MSSLFSFYSSAETETAPSSSVEDGVSPQQAQHAALITLVLGKMEKIQREIKGRRYRNIHAPVEEAKKALISFRDIEYPPKKEILSPPEWMTNDKDDGNDTPSSSNPTPTTITTSPPSDDESSLPDTTLTATPMHPAIITTLECHILLMTHPQKTPKICELSLDCLTLLITNSYVSGRAGLRHQDTLPTSAIASASLTSQRDLSTTTNDDDNHTPPPSILHRLIEGITKCSESPSEIVQTAMTKTLLSLMTCRRCGVHEASMLTAVRATFHVYLVSKSAAAKEVSKATLLDMLKSVFNRMETYDAVNGEMGGGVGDGETYVSLKDVGGGGKEEESSGGATATATAMAFASQYHTDGYLLFRALCKLSAKSLPGDEGAGGVSSTPKILQSFATAVDPLALHSKILSLELILSVFQHCGEAFKTGDKFIYAVQNYLCVSLLKNCMSSHTEVAFLSLKIFLVLVYNFKSHLKSEIEVFLANIFLRVLESPNSGIEQKALVLEALRALCSDPTMLTQIFLNYDCDFDAVNLYRSIVNNLTKLSNKPPANKKDNTEDSELALAGLEVLVIILRAFLKALNLPGGDDEFSSSNARGNRLQLDIGLAVKPDDAATTTTKTITSDPTTTLDNDDTSTIQSESSSITTAKIVDAFNQKSRNQQNFETGVIKFTLAGKDGLWFFIQNGFVDCDAHSVATFFHRHAEQLDKTQIGEILGREPHAAFDKSASDPEKGGPGFYVRILHHYVDAMDYTGLMFDDAIRSFLAGFRLPGEAQKIDRIMEKFAERYTRQNEEVFPSADTAFILGFSVIMLNTDLHNPNIKQEKKMTMESFIRNNRGISVDGGDLPVEMLEGIFTRIRDNPFTLKEDDDARAAAAATTAGSDFQNLFVFDASTFLSSSAEDRRREKFRKEKEEMMTASEQLFKRRPKMNRNNNNGGGSQRTVPSTSPNTDAIAPSDVIKPMFDVTWGPLIGTLSQVLETTEDHNSIALCLNGFVYAVRISSHSGMSLARDTFVNSLAKFTTLGSMKEMKYKNIESIRTLLSIAIIDGEFLAESWGPVLQCISQLALLQLSASGLARDDEFLSSDPVDNTPESSGFFRTPTPDEIARETEESNGRAVLAAVNEILIDKVFSSSVKLSARGIVHFTEQLIAVSVGEITGDGKRNIMGISQSQDKSKNPVSRHSLGGDRPRIFSLQRLVEVADYNMDVRPRITWTQMWEMMANHFATIGCHKNAQMSMFAIDSLRQLSFKFLEKPELSDFNFQRLFLRPFLLIMENPGSRDDIRELVLRCVDNMIRLLSINLRSGWKIFFSILTLSARDPSEKISTLGLAILQRLLDEHLDQLCRLGEGSNGTLPPPEDTINDDDDNENDNDNDDPVTIDALEKRRRNANAEDFVGLCRASLSFVQTEELAKPLPIGLSMRALCHTACYADLIAEKRVLPPIGHSQSHDPFALGYTYPNLPPHDAEQMALWRPLFDGLAAGISSTARSNSGGVGCLVHRGSIMTTRAILLRHGHVFSPSQWTVIFKDVILPAIQSAAEYDNFPVIGIVSESPALSSLDFLNEALPLPPGVGDEGLKKFKEKSASLEGAPRREMGMAELLVEASFADLRHGGDGNLSRAYGLSNDQPRKNVHEQPFPDSWIATTAPMAMGMLTDILGEMILFLGKEGREKVYPILLAQYRSWALGTPTTFSVGGDDDDDVSILSDLSANGASWKPCEALVRIGCVEFSRTTMVLANNMERLEKDEVIEWWKVISESLSETITMNAALEVDLHRDLVDSKLIALGLKKRGENGETIAEKIPEENDDADDDDDDNNDETNSKGDKRNNDDADGGDSDSSSADNDQKTPTETPYGKGVMTNQRMDFYDDEEVEIREVELTWGATLYTTQDIPVKTSIPPSSSSTIPSNDDAPPPPPPPPPRPTLNNPQLRPSYVEALSCENYLDRFIPALKTRCVAAHILNQQLPPTITAMQSYLSEATATTLLSALDKSRTMAYNANRDQDLAHAFKEAMRSEWDDGVEEVERALAAMGRSTSVKDLSAGSDAEGSGEMFFLTQEAGANRAMIHMLLTLYCRKDTEGDDDGFVARWDRQSFAEPRLMNQLTDVLRKFLKSEVTEGHSLDVNVWRSHSSDGATKVAMYCTSFVGVVISILHGFLMFGEDQFRNHVDEIYPLLCDLVCVQSDEVRQIVKDILIRKVKPLLGVGSGGGSDNHN